MKGDYTMRIVFAALLIFGTFNVYTAQNQAKEIDVPPSKLATKRNVTATDAFKQLTSLNGNWEGKFSGWPFAHCCLPAHGRWQRSCGDKDTGAKP